MKAPAPYGDDATYRLAAEWVACCETVSDWGCGKGWMRRFCGPGYVGIDGSLTPFADIVVDLAEYRCISEGVVMRHVLEHDYRWATIFDNAIASFSRRACVVLFTPLAPKTHVLQTEPEYGDVPVISFALTDLTSRIPDCVSWTAETIPTSSFYGTETLLRLAR